MYDVDVAVVVGEVGLDELAQLVGPVLAHPLQAREHSESVLVCVDGVGGYTRRSEKREGNEGQERRGRGGEWAER